MRDRDENFIKLNVKIVVVTFEANYLARSYVEETVLKWPLIIDENRELYKSYGMLSASFWDIWGPKTWIAYLKEIIKGQKLKISKADVSQRGGDVLIDPDGIVQMHHVGAGPADRPSVEMILEIINEWNDKQKIKILIKRQLDNRDSPVFAFFQKMLRRGKDSLENSNELK